VVATNQAGAGDAAQAGPTGDPLGSWREGATKQAIVDFVQRVTTEGPPDFVPPQERVAVFDNDGTLWCEKPMPIQLDFILRRLVVMADQDPGAAHPPTLGRAYLACGYVPMVELLGYLEAAGFRNYIASGGGRDFMRPISQSCTASPASASSAAVSRWPGRTTGAAAGSSAILRWMLHDDPASEFDYAAGAEQASSRPAATAGP
jgi:hypothetical protein